MFLGNQIPENWSELSLEADFKFDEAKFLSNPNLKNTTDIEKIEF